MQPTAINEENIQRMFNQGMTIPTIIQCIWNMEKRRKYHATQKDTRKAVETILLKAYIQKYCI